MRRLLLLFVLVAGVAAGVVAVRAVEPLGDGTAAAVRDRVDAAKDRAADTARRARERAGRARDRVRQARVRRARCPEDVPQCAAVSGRIVLVERVDPDGDGDLHVVIADGDVTAPGFTAVDVRPGLRPARDPEVGNLASAAGPVQRGSFGQLQIHALTFHTARGG